MSYQPEVQEARLDHLEPEPAKTSSALLLLYLGVGALAGLLAGAVWYTAEVGAAKPAWPAALESRVGRAAREDKPVLLIFHADWCGACRSLESQVLPRDEVKTALTGWVVIKFNVDRETDTARHYGVHALPTLIALTPQGQVIDQLKGAPSPPALLDWLKESKGG